jgi:Ca2+-binding RTX toxin-like protein
MRSKIGRALLLATATFLVTGYVAMPAVHAAATPKCFGKSATIVSSKATINGTSHADVIVATGKGKHTINGKGGNDLLCGGAGTDNVAGGAGNDKINGGAGDDGSFLCLPGSKVWLNGGAGNDVVLGGAGNNCLQGGPGDDILVGGPADDLLMGGPGSDHLNGGSNGNPLTTSALGDTASFIDLPASVNADLTKGTAKSGSDSDTMKNIENLFGTQFGDTLTANSNCFATNPPSINGLEGWLGDDTLDGNGCQLAVAAYLLAPAGVTVSQSGPGNSPGSSSGGEGNDTLKSIAGVAGSQFDDTITGGNILFGGGGNDTINAPGSTNDTIYGDGRSPAPSDGNDTINAGGGNDTVFGGGGNDNLDGGAGTDGVDAGAGTDTCKNFETGPGGTGTPVGCEA